MHKIFVIGDLHLKRTDPLGVILPSGMNSRLADKLQALETIVDTAIKENATHIVQLGDVFDAVNPPVFISRCFWDIMAKAIKIGIKIRIISGNHDTTGRVTNLEDHIQTTPDNVKLVLYEPFAEEIEGVTLQYIPYTENIDKFMEWSASGDKRRIVFVHQEFKGAMLGASNIRTQCEVDASIFNQPNTYVFSGHIHKFQNLTDRVIYVGDIIKDDYSERMDPKVYCQIEVKDGVITTRFCDIQQRPMIQIEIIEEDVNNIYNREAIPSDVDVKDALLKVVFKGSGSWLRTINKNKFKKRFKNVLKIDFDEQRTDGTKEVLETKTSSMEEKVIAYCKLKGKDKEYEKVGLETTKEVMEEK